MLLATDRNAFTLAKLSGPVKSSLEAVKQDLKDVDHGLKNHSKTLDKVCTLLHPAEMLF